MKLNFCLTTTLPVCLIDHSHKAGGQHTVTILRHNNKLTSGISLLLFWQACASVLCTFFYLLSSWPSPFSCNRTIFWIITLAYYKDTTIFFKANTTASGSGHLADICTSQYVQDYMWGPLSYLWTAYPVTLWPHSLIGLARLKIL